MSAPATIAQTVLARLGAFTSQELEALARSERPRACSQCGRSLASVRHSWSVYALYVNVLRMHARYGCALGHVTDMDIPITRARIRRIEALEQARARRLEPAAVRP